MPESKSEHTVAIALILPGIALALFGPRLDGFAKGLCLGAGLMLILIGVYVLGAHMRRPRHEDDSMWLPSRDDEQR